MNYTEIKAKKGQMTQIFKEDGTVIPVTVLKVAAGFELLKSGDKINVRGISKGHGFAGVVKRWNFHGGPATHGSKTHRRTGSIGAGTTPGRVYKGKKMPGRLGVKKVMVRGLSVIEVNNSDKFILVKGAVPGHVNSAVSILLKGEERHENKNN